jgi:tRNA dimethylallyltransferase
MDAEKKVLVVVGPTASGKSDFAVLLAQRTNGEIISADSRQVFKGLDIGTGKITKEEMQDIPHYMLSVYDLSSEVGVARYQEDATLILNDILERGKTPIICGGTGQYIDALIYDTILPKVPPNHEFRYSLETLSNDELFSLLFAKDPCRAEAIDKHNRVRLIRALEVVEVLGEVPKQHQPKFIWPTEIFLMDVDRSTLRAKITKRLEKRMDTGMLTEGKEIFDKGHRGAELKRFGLEYEAMGKYFEGELDLHQMKEYLITKIMQYAKRQQTWNKKYIEIATLIPVKE